MTRRRRLNPTATCDVDDLLGILSDDLGKADAFITTAEELIERSRILSHDEDSDDDLQRRRNHIEHLLEAAKRSVRAAIDTNGEIAELAQRLKGDQ